MTIDLGTPAAAGLGGVVDALRDWQDDDAPLQLHPGDVGWFWRFGAEATAAAVRTWSRDGRVLAAGLLDGSTVLRLAIAPDAQDDEELAHRLVADIVRPERGVLPDGEASVEAPRGALVRDRLAEQGWQEGEPWTPLHRDLSEAVPDPGLRVEVVGPDQAHVRVAVQRAAFDRSTFTDERWHAMAAGLPYADARCLVVFDGGDAVAAATVWSAGAGRPGLIEPLGVHRDHRDHGFGTAVTVAAAAALRELGASSVAVCTRSANVGGVATYEAAGLDRGSAVPDLCRKG